jgi:hypothetical protein
MLTIPVGYLQSRELYLLPFQNRMANDKQSKTCDVSGIFVPP